MAMAITVPSRLWLGGVISPKRDLALIMTVVGMGPVGGPEPGDPGHAVAVRLFTAHCYGMTILVGVDGLANYVTAVTRVVHDPVRTGRRGRPRLVATAGLLLGQVIKHRAGRCVVGVTRRVVRGTAAAITAVVQATGTGTGINTAYIERLNATFRGALNPLVRRGRAIAHGVGTLTAGMYLVGCAYNFCWAHDGLQVAAPSGGRARSGGSGPRRWRPG